MPKVPKEVIKESYLLKSTFFFRRLHELGYVKIFDKIHSSIKQIGGDINWSDKDSFGVPPEAWEIIESNGIEPATVFVHPNFLRTFPDLIKYYRCLAMIPQKGLSKLTGVSNLKSIEEGAKEIPESRIETIVFTLNQFISSVLLLNGWYKEDAIKAMVLSTAGTSIDGSWRNKIGAEGERVVKEIILSSLLEKSEVAYCILKNDDRVEVGDIASLGGVDKIKTIYLTNSYSIVFRSEPDGTILSPDGKVTGGIEVKAGIDPAAALERLGAMFKSFDNIKQSSPDAETVLVISCLTDEVQARINESKAVNFTFILTDITLGNRSAENRFVNKIREIANLTGRRL